MTTTDIFFILTTIALHVDQLCYELSVIIDDVDDPPLSNRLNSALSALHNAFEQIEWVRNCIEDESEAT